MTAPQDAPDDLRMAPDEAGRESCGTPRRDAPDGFRTTPGRDAHCPGAPGALGVKARTDLRVARGSEYIPGTEAGIRRDCAECRSRARNGRARPSRGASPYSQVMSSPFAAPHPYNPLAGTTLLGAGRIHIGSAHSWFTCGVKTNAPGRSPAPQTGFAPTGPGLQRPKNHIA